MRFKVDPEMPCKCITIKQKENLFKIEVDNSKLSLEDKGEYEIEIEFLSQQNKKIFGGGAKTNLFVMKPFVVKKEIEKVEIKKPEPKKQEHLIKCDVENEEDLSNPTPVKVYFESMDSEGVIKFQFNQQLIIPDFINSFNSTTIQEYFEFKYYGTYEKLFDDQKKYEIKMLDWTDFQMTLRTVFDKPKQISSDARDRFTVKFLKPNLFISKKTCLKLTDKGP